MTNRRTRPIQSRTRAISSASLTPRTQETDQFLEAWVAVTARMTPNQLRAHGKPLLDVWLNCIGSPDPQESRTEQWEDVAPANLTAVLKSLAAQHKFRSALRATALDRRIDWLADILALDAIERSMLHVIARCAVRDEWQALLRALPGSGGALSPLRIALLGNLRPGDVEDRLGMGARLWRAGLIDNDGDGELSANRLLFRIARSNASPARLVHHLMPVAPRSTLRWEDFAYLGSQRDIAAALIAAKSPSAILLYGPPGTGKTEFARLLADRTGMRAVFAGLEDDSGREPTRPERLAHLALVRAMTSSPSKRLVVMDEADDVLQLGAFEERGRRSKLFLNRMIEEGEGATIWIINDPDCLEESLLRRMHLVIELPLPPRSVRRQVVANHAAKARLKLAASEIERLAGLPAPPAVIASALKVAKTIQADVNAAILISEGHIHATSGKTPAPETLPQCYDPALALADVDLDHTAGQLEHACELGWSLLLAGPSGTGKSAYARHLAERLGLDLLVKRGSDLLGPHVGETEANITGAFRTAARLRSLLLIDEADDFLADRQNARRSWERSMVNQMLCEMEALEAPFVATTNHPDLLDPAVQRRFTMQIKFHPLDERRAQEQFQSWFGCKAPHCCVLEGLTPGDFALVARRARILGETNPEQLASWLCIEAERRRPRRAVIGFAA